MNATLLQGRIGVRASSSRQGGSIALRGRDGLRPGTRRIRFETRKFRSFQIPASRSTSLPSTAELLTGGGDSRITCAPRGSNQYGCSPTPESGVLAFGSSTASTISPEAFAAAESLRLRLEQAARIEPASVTYERELDRVRRRLLLLAGLEDVRGLDIIFGASGTDLHLFASQLMLDSSATAPVIIRVEAAETGRGVPDALAGCHFSNGAALGDFVSARVPLDCGHPVEIREVACRTAEGPLRPIAQLDAEVEATVAQAATEGRRVLLTMVDVSKTGIIAPSPGCVAKLQRRFPAHVEVLVDACQFRLSPATLRAYLGLGFLVAITGSKFITGPTFCGALLVPSPAARRLRDRELPHALKSYSARADWPRDWAARASLKDVANYGLLLRWEAALTELRAFHSLPEPAVHDFLDAFRCAVQSHLRSDSAFELLPVPSLARAPVSAGESWDRVPTIFSFLLRRQNAAGEWVWLNCEETKRVHELLREDLSHLSSGPNRTLAAFRCQLGQPVACGIRDGVAVSALRICASSRLAVDALALQGRGADAVLTDALAVLDKARWLASLPLIQSSFSSRRAA